MGTPEVLAFYIYVCYNYPSHPRTEKAKMTTFARFDYDAQPVKRVTTTTARPCIVCARKLSTYNTGVACERHSGAEIEQALIASGARVRRVGYVLKPVQKQA